MSEFQVAGPTPGLCMYTNRGRICTRTMAHEGEHLWVTDTLNTEQRFIEVAARFPVTRSSVQEPEHTDGGPDA